MFSPLYISKLCVIHFLPLHVKDTFLLSLRTFSFQIPALYHDVAFISFNLQQDIYNYIPHTCFIPQNVLKTYFFHYVLVWFSIYLCLFTNFLIGWPCAPILSILPAISQLHFVHLLPSTTCPNCPFSDFLFASHNEISTILLVTYVKS